MRCWSADSLNAPLWVSCFAINTGISPWQALVGLLVPFLHTELQLSHSQAALHMSAFATGLLLSGTVGDRLVKAWGRHALFRDGGAGMGLGALGMSLGWHLAITLSSNVIMRFGGSLLLMVLQAGLSDQHGEQRATALAEANVGASFCASFAPLVVGASIGPGWSWRSPSILGVLMLLGLGWRFVTLPIPTVSLRSGRSGPIPRRLPGAYWGILVGPVHRYCHRGCMAAWSSDFLIQTANIDPARASALISLFFLAMVIGRFAGSRLSRRFASVPLLLVAIGIACFGFSLFWWIRLPIVNLAGLLIIGLDTANFFPLAVALALGEAPEQPERANARIAFGMGAAIFSVPYVMGWIADQFGFQLAFATLGGLLLGAAAITYLTVYSVGSDRGDLLAGPCLDMPPLS